MPDLKKPLYYIMNSILWEEHHYEQDTPWDFDDVDPEADKGVLTSIVPLIDAFGGEAISIRSHMKHNPYDETLGDAFVWKAKIIKAKGSTEDGPLAEAVKTALCQEVLIGAKEAWGAYDDPTLDIFLKVIQDYAREKGVLGDVWVANDDDPVSTTYGYIFKTQREAQTYCLA